jgi:hypothetical protein
MSCTPKPGRVSCNKSYFPLNKDYNLLKRM